MSTESRATGMFVDTRLVGKKIGVDSEGSFDWAVVEDFSFDLFLIGTNGVDAGTEVFVFGVGGLVAIDTFLGAFRCRFFTLALEQSTWRNADKDSRCHRVTYRWQSLVDTS